MSGHDHSQHDSCGCGHDHSHHHPAAPAEGSAHGAGAELAHALGEHQLAHEVAAQHQDLRGHALAEDGKCCVAGAADHAVVAAAHVHTEDCDCAGHRLKNSGEHGTVWATVAPLLACALCPVCLSTYAGILSAFGLSLSITELHHDLLTFVSIALALGVGLWRARKLRHLGPVSVTLVGCIFIVASHFTGHGSVLNYGGMAMLIGGMIWDRRLWRQRFHGAPASAPTESPALVPPKVRALAES